MVTITKDTCGKATQEYIRDLLSKNLTDTQSPPRSGSEWIFKSHEEEVHIAGKLPRVYIEQIGESRTSLTPKIIGPVTIRLDVEVWDSGSTAEDNRDQIADEIIKILKNDSSTDGTKTMRQQSLMYKSSSQTNSDTTIENVLVRIKRVSIELKYYGH